MPKEPKEQKVKEPKPVKALKEKPPKEKKAKKPVVEKFRVEQTPVVKGALSRLGMYQKTKSTLILYASAETSASPEVVFQVWSEIEKWPQWQKPFVTTARWADKDNHEWEPGVKIELTYNYGGTLGKIVSKETVREVDKNLSVVWFKIDKGTKIFNAYPLATRSCYIWFFEPLLNGGTNIIQCQVLAGPRPFMARMTGTGKKLSAVFKDMVDNLIKAVERSPQAKPQSSDSNTPV
ncbi:MAG TPA: SRPBCC family protein [Fimbriimonadaceae bacterium]|jgi:hypothetical protein